MTTLSLVRIFTGFIEAFPIVIPVVVAVVPIFITGDVNAIVPADIVKSPVFIAVVPPVDINLLDGNALGISAPAEYMSIDE